MACSESTPRCAGPRCHLLGIPCPEEGGVSCLHSVHFPHPALPSTWGRAHRCCRAQGSQPAACAAPHVPALPPPHPTSPSQPAEMGTSPWGKCKAGLVLQQLSDRQAVIMKSIFIFYLLSRYKDSASVPGNERCLALSLTWL